MALEQKLALKLAQKLVMTPSLQQAIKLLQMTRLELQTTLTQELVENPVLEEADVTYEEDGDDEAPASDEPEETDSMSDIDLEAYFNEYLEGQGPNDFSASEPGVAPPLENTLTREPDLYDHLLWQLHMMELPPLQLEIAELVVGNLNPDGFLVATVEEIQAMGSTENGSGLYAEEDVLAAFEVVRSLDPPGVGFATLRESLRHQLDVLGEEEEAISRRVVEECWDLFLKRQFQAIAKRFGLPLADLEEHIEVIRELETRPGRKFTDDRTHYVEPDVAITKDGDDYVILLNDDGLPRLRISNAYRQLLRGIRAQGGDTEAKQYIQEKLRSAMWLIKSIDQRQRTIYKVANSIVRQQRAFLDHGIEFLRPMILRDVADDIGMHESTVSRVVSNKYMHTPRGLFPLKFFFHSGIHREYGDEISSRTVKSKIEYLIQGEDAKRPLSDNQLTAALKREGINIARRTVAKYRDELGIASSTHRKAIF